MKKFALSVLFAALSVGFVSCSDDDKKDDKPTTPTTPATTTCDKKCPTSLGAGLTCKVEGTDASCKLVYDCSSDYNKTVDASAAEGIKCTAKGGACKKSCPETLKDGMTCSVEDPESENCSLKYDCADTHDKATDTEAAEGIKCTAKDICTKEKKCESADVLGAGKVCSVKKAGEGETGDDDGCIVSYDCESRYDKADDANAVGKIKCTKKPCADYICSSTIDGVVASVKYDPEAEDEEDKCTCTYKCQDGLKEEAAPGTEEGIICIVANKACSSDPTKCNEFEGTQCVKGQCRTADEVANKVSCSMDSDTDFCFGDVRVYCSSGNGESGISMYIKEDCSKLDGATCEIASGTKIATCKANSVPPTGECTVDDIIHGCKGEQVWTVDDDYNDIPLGWKIHTTSKCVLDEETNTLSWVPQADDPCSGKDSCYSTHPQYGCVGENINANYIQLNSYCASSLNTAKGNIACTSNYCEANACKPNAEIGDRCYSNDYCKSGKCSADKVCVANDQT